MALSVLGLLVAFIMSVAIGPVNIPPGIALAVLGAKLSGMSLPIPSFQTFSTILLEIRLPHALLLLLTGAALAGSGAGYQGLFRNPLADPYLIGVASGAQKKR